MVFDYFNRWSSFNFIYNDVILKNLFNQNKKKQLLNLEKTLDFTMFDDIFDYYVINNKRKIFYIQKKKIFFNFFFRLKKKKMKFKLYNDYYLYNFYINLNNNYYSNLINYN